MPVDTVHISRHDTIGRVEPEVHGHFAEHLGRCIYGGIWVGEDDRVPTDDGFRTDTVELLTDLDLRLLRWPGGCFADDYHWRDGVGPREERSPQPNHFWAQGREKSNVESNEFGTEEFMRLCERVDAEPMLAANVGSGTPAEAQNWVEYCNSDTDVALGQERAENGHSEPHDVTYWGVGNENWGCGGNFDPETYAREFRRFAHFMRLAGAEETIACGHIEDDWNRRFLAELTEPDMLDHLSIHRYFGRFGRDCGSATEFDEEQYYLLLAESLKVGRDVDRAAAAIETYASTDDVGIAVDEWGAWHPEATSDNGLEQENSVRDAVAAAGVLDDFNHRADLVSMANIAQTVNVLQCVVQTDEEAAWPTPTYRLFDLYRPHAGATALRTTVDTDAVETDLWEVPLVSASATTDDDGTYVTLSNRALDEERAVRVALDREVSDATGEVLFADHDPADYSTRENAEEFEATDLDVSIEDGAPVVELPPNSVAGLSVESA
ncbi:alpha-N-arabinofuranosidase [Halosimplex aquaticum]|uniref:non-reducing end alpha-L-arabinofuranosidase n=1 Tax=Halosimplex aquaticum TaxID=3026162 RepID=A0ABD5Y735_9EURY|nr:alpha-L-arabinofuranosidase C-terminal domain-containing protein [Halosimplex aquaticum]